MAYCSGQEFSLAHESLNLSLMRILHIGRVPRRLLLGAKDGSCKLDIANQLSNERAIDFRINSRIPVAAKLCC
jgi:hypothetical protein